MNKKNTNKKAIDAEINKALLDDFDRIENFVVTKWKLMIYAGIAVVILVAVAYSVYLNKKRSVLRAENALASANTKEELQSAIAQYGDNRAADFARIRLARIFISEKKYTEAAAEFKKVSQISESENLRQRMSLDEGYMLEDEKKLTEAVKSFAQVGNNGMNTPGVRAEAFYSAGRIAVLAGQKKEAANYFKQLSLISGPADSPADFWKKLGASVAADLK